MRCCPWVVRWSGPRSGKSRSQPPGCPWGAFSVYAAPPLAGPQNPDNQARRAGQPLLSRTIVHGSWTELGRLARSRPRLTPPTRSTAGGTEGDPRRLREGQDASTPATLGATRNESASGCDSSPITEAQTVCRLRAWLAATRIAAAAPAAAAATRNESIIGCMPTGDLEEDGPHGRAGA